MQISNELKAKIREKFDATLKLVEKAVHVIEIHKIEDMLLSFFFPDQYVDDNVQGCKFPMGRFL